MLPDSVRILRWKWPEAVRMSPSQYPWSFPGDIGDALTEETELRRRKRFAEKLF
jgi:hypothetical protein